MDLDALYQDIILDHYKNPQYAGLREPYDAEVVHVNPTCGDEVTLRVHLDGDRVADVSYDAIGCSISQASASVMAGLVIGRPVDEAAALEQEFLALMQSKGKQQPDEDRLQDAVAFAGVAKFPSRIKCALLSWMALTDAMARAGYGGPEPRPTAQPADHRQSAASEGVADSGGGETLEKR